VINSFRTGFPDIHWVIEEMVVEGDKVFSPKNSQIDVQNDVLVL